MARVLEIYTIDRNHCFPERGEHSLLDYGEGCVRETRDRQRGKSSQCICLVISLLF